MRVSMNVEPFSVEFDSDYDADWETPNAGTLTVQFFGHEIWSLKVSEYVSEYVQDDVKDIAMQELGKLIAKGLSERVKVNDYDGVRIDG